MRTIYICVRKSEHDFNTLPEGNVVHIFDYLSGSIGLPSIRRTVEAALDLSDPKQDMLVLNGPTYLVAIAGYVWMANEAREKYNFLLYSSSSRKFVLNDAYIDTLTHDQHAETVAVKP